VKDFNVRPYPFLIIASLFFLWGVFTCMNTLIIPHLEQLFFGKEDISFNFRNVFFGAYFIIAIPAVMLLNHNGYKTSIIIGLLIVSLGAFLFVFAAEYISYPLFITGVFFLAAGITVLQVAANTYIVLMGDERFAASRLSLAQAINSLGYVSVLAIYLFDDFTINKSMISTAQIIKSPYLILGFLLVILLLFFLRNNLPAFPEKQKFDFIKALKNRKLLFGAAAIFFYVGAEVGLSYYIRDLYFLSGFEEDYLVYALIIFWGGIGLGRLIGYYAFHTLNSIRMIQLFAFIAITALISAFFPDYHILIWIFAAIGLLNSVMFPVIFSKSLRALKQNVNTGAGFLVMAIAGGAVIPKIIHVIRSNYSFVLSLSVIMFSYLVIFFYARYMLRAEKE